MNEKTGAGSSEVGRGSHSLEAYTSSLLQKKLREGEIVYWGESFHFNDASGNRRDIELIKPDNVSDATWKKLNPEDQRLLLITRLAQSLYWTKPAEQILREIQERYGTVPPSVIFPSR